MSIQTLSLVLTIVGSVSIVLAVSGGHGLHFHNNHSYVGLAILVAVVVQVSLALVRPHAPDAGSNEAKTAKRANWEILHRGLAVCILIAGVANLYLGATNYHLSEGGLVRVRDAVPAVIAGCLLIFLLGALGVWADDGGGEGGSGGGGGGSGIGSGGKAGAEVADSSSCPHDAGARRTSAVRKVSAAGVELADEVGV